MDISADLEKLNSLLPLQQRQRALPAGLRALHRMILQCFLTQGRPPDRAGIAAVLGTDDIDPVLARLADDDLVVLAADRRTVTGAYPFTSEERLHRVRLDGHTVHAMCSLDALSIAPMFAIETRIDSRCHVSGRPILIHMRAATVLDASPGEPWIGIRWQSTSGCAAQSLCLEMVYLYDAGTAAGWQAQDPANISIQSLPDAIRFGSAFFCPLVE